MKNIKPNYLTYQENGSNKFYITVALDDKTGLIGYGAIDNSVGSWSVKSLGETKKKTSDKIKKGYTPDHHTTIQTKAIKKMIEAVKSHFNVENVKIDHNGILKLEEKSVQKPKSPRRYKSKKIYTWI